MIKAVLKIEYRNFESYGSHLDAWTSLKMHMTDRKETAKHSINLCTEKLMMIVANTSPYAQSEDYTDVHLIPWIDYAQWAVKEILGDLTESICDLHMADRWLSEIENNGSDTWTCDIEMVEDDDE